MAGAIGNVLEWYDFAIFGYFAPIIGSQFFPETDRTASLLGAFAVFAVGYFMRPLGGVVFGHIGDRLGRKPALQYSVALMAVPTFLLGLLPTYDQIGLWAAAGLVLVRLVQGLSVGGELIGSISYIVETAPRARRAYFGSWSLFSAVSGILLGSLAAALLHNLLDHDALHDWGWRLPFIAGLAMGVFGLWTRRGLTETAEFREIKQAGGTARSPVKEALATMPGTIVRVVGLAALMAGSFYTLFVWWPTYLTHVVRPPISHAMTVNTVSLLVFLVLLPLVARLSDSVGRRVVLMASAMGTAVLCYPLVALTDFGVLGWALAAQIAFAFLTVGAQAPMPAIMVEMFPPSVRYSGVGMGYNLAQALVGGTSPLICTWLVAASGDAAAPAYYLMALSLVTLAAAWGLKARQG